MYYIYIIYIYIYIYIYMYIYIYNTYLHSHLKKNWVYTMYIIHGYVIYKKLYDARFFGIEYISGFNSLYTTNIIIIKWIILLNNIF